MPPWPPDPGYNHLAYEKVLSDYELTTINDWVDNGMPSGDLALAPPPPVFSGGLTMDAPNDTVALPVYEIATNDDVYITFVVHSNYTETKYLNQLEFLPGDPSLVHHAIYYQDTSDLSWQMDSAYSGPGYASNLQGSSVYAQNFGGYVPGQGAVKFPVNMGIEILPGADFAIDVHYAPGNMGKIDSSKLFFKFCDVPVVRPIWQERYLFATPPCLTNGPLVIGANTIRTFNEQSTLPYKKTLLGIAPHSHLICKSWEVFMVNAVGDTTNLISIPQWDFGWQYTYLFTKAIKVLPGTTFFGEAVFDNTVNNPNNPSNPPVNVFEGQSTMDEMMACRFWVMDYEPGDEDIILDSAFYGLPTGTAQAIASAGLALMVSPNPAADVIHLNAVIPAHQVNWTLNDAFGRKVEVINEKNIPDGIYSKELNIAMLPPGIYFLTMQSGGKTDSKKVIVSR